MRNTMMLLALLVGLVLLQLPQNSGEEVLVCGTAMSEEPTPILPPLPPPPPPPRA